MGGVVAGAIFLLTVLSPLTKDENKTPPPLQNHTSQTPTTTSKIPDPTPTPIVHKIEKGDTLYSIARQYYGSAKFWINLWNDNDFISDPRIIRNGWELKISNVKPNQVEKPSPKLAAIYEEIVNPSPTPSGPEALKGRRPTIEPNQAAVAGASIQAQGSPSSFDETYKQAGAKYSVPWEILYGLHIMETGGRDGAISSGYGTGAQGPLQFMPGTWAFYGVDGNGDGAVDINSAIDAIYGAANYLASHGGVEQGLKSYGGDTQKALNAARSRGWNQ